MDKRTEFIKMYQMLCEKYNLTLVPVVKLVLGDDGRIISRAENTLVELPVN